ncbi:MAG: Flp pilus assembly complex ATPase component TadA [Planctomycetales bacterium]|nr:Flp pilus assembly complex ATPase component TadA [Planctomycetales bacterium]
MVFGFGGKSKKPKAEPEEEREIEHVKFMGPFNGAEPNLTANTKLVDAGLVRAKDLISDALSRRAESLRIEPKGPAAIVGVMVDGVAYPAGRLSKQEALAVTQMLKLLGGMDIKDRKTAQTGGMKAEFEGKKYELHLKSEPAEDAERLTVKAVNLSTKLDTTQDIGMGDDLRKKMRATVEEHGVLLMAGPPSSGTSSTLYAVLRGLDAYLNSIQSACDTGGRSLHNITPFAVNPTDPISQTIQRTIRAETDILLIDPLKDANVAKEVFSKAGDISLLTEMTAKDTAAAVLQLIDWVGDTKVVADGLRGVLGTKLVRLLCPSCKQAYKPNPQFLQKAGLPETVTVLYRKPLPTKNEEGQLVDPEPCKKCGDVGYMGRTALFEYLEVTPEMKTLIAGKPDVAAIRTQMKKEKMLVFQQDGLRQVADGKTALEELQRVFAPPKPAGSAPAKPAASASAKPAK